MRNARVARFVAAVAAAGTLIVACRDSGVPTSPLQAPDAISKTISDGASGGNAHFYFLPPMVAAPAYSGTFDPALSPQVTICAWSGAACAGQAIATFTMTSGSGSETVRLSAADSLYIVNWHTDQFNVRAGSLYRVSVSVGGATIGFADVAIVSNGNSKNAITAGDISVVAGKTLPIKFRIELGASAPIDLGALPGGTASEALAVNDAGDIVGWSTTAGGATHAVLWHNGTIIDLGTLAGGTTSTAYGINKFGQIVGFSDGPGFAAHATLWSSSPPYAITDLGTLPTGNQSVAHGINSSGEVVGSSLSALGNCCDPVSFHGFSFDLPNGPMQDLGTLATFIEIFGTRTTEAYGASDAGVISGAGRPYWTGEFFGWVKFPGDPVLHRPLGLDQGNGSIPIAISATGQMAGWSRISCFQSALCDAAVIWSSPLAQAVALVDTAAVHSSRANGISGSGDAVGYANLGGIDQALFWAAGQTTGTTFVTLPGATGNYPQAINNSRLIVGYAQLPAGRRAFSYSIGR